MTITINLKGRLGNQLFQYAALRNIAIIKNYDSYINTDIEWHGQSKLLKYFNIKNSNPSNIIYTYNQPNGSNYFDKYIYNINDNTILDGHFENVDYFKENIDIITMFHVLEHLCDPIKVLIELKKKMHKESLLIIEVPHANDILISYYNNHDFKKNTFWSEHLILHTQKSLENLLINVGFSNIKVVFEQRYNFFNHIHWITKGKPGGHNILFDNNYYDLNNEYNKFLIEEKITDTLIAYCKI